MRTNANEEKRMNVLLEVSRLRYAQGYSMVEISRRIGRPTQYVSRLLSEAKEKGIIQIVISSSESAPSTATIENAESPPARHLRAFLCHSSSDKAIVRELYNRLNSDGVAAWLDEERILPGQNWQQQISAAVRESDVVIVCLSRESINKKGYVQKEIKEILDEADYQPDDRIFLIPCRLELVEVPNRLRQKQWVDYFAAEGYERLLNTLRECAQGLNLTPPSGGAGRPNKAHGISLMVENPFLNHIKQHTLIPWSMLHDMISEAQSADAFVQLLEEHVGATTTIGEVRGALKNQKPSIDSLNHLRKMLGLKPWPHKTKVTK